MGADQQIISTLAIVFYVFSGRNLISDRYLYSAIFFDRSCELIWGVEKSCGRCKGMLYDKSSMCNYLPSGNKVSSGLRSVLV